MKTRLHSRLITAIQGVLDRACESPDLWQEDAYVHPELADHMAAAAVAVFDATIASSKFTDEQRVSS